MQWSASIECAAINITCTQTNMIGSDYQVPSDTNIYNRL